MNCRLCDSDLSSVNKCDAHIFPRGLLKFMSQEEFGKLLIVGTDMGKKKKAPIGSYDPNILCNKCDNKIGHYDDYALTFISNAEIENHPVGVGWKANNIDPHKLKLFCMSYLWRESITTRSEFSGISLGSQHEEKIKNFIKNDDQGTPDDYTVIFAKFTSKTGKGAGIIFPARTRIRGLTFYEGYLPNLYKFWIKVDSRRDNVMSGISVGAQEEMYVHDKGDFDMSIEKGIMVKAVRQSQ